MPTKLSLAKASPLLPDQTLAQALSATPQERNTTLCKTQSIAIVCDQAELERGA
jgi:hypothetical protein